MKTLIKNAYVISDEIEKNSIADVYIENGIISEIAPGIEKKDAEYIDAEGNLLMPGFVDMYCKICDAGYENKDNIVKVSNSAAAGGYTTVTTSPNTQPVIDNKTVVEYVISKTKEHSKVNILPYGSITKGCKGKEAAEMGEMIMAGVAGISDGGKSIDDSALLRDVFLYSKMFEIPIITHCIDRGLSGDGVINEGYMATKLGLKGIPREAEEVIISRNLILSKYTGARLHISHVTTRGSINLIRRAKKDGVRVTCSTCPHYFSLSESAVENYNTFAKVMPPLRTDDDIVAVKEGIIDGTIDVITSGHSPAPIDKKVTEFDKASFGISGLETSFALSYTNLIDDDNFNIYDLVRLMSCNPVKILGFKNKGFIRTGYDADLIIADINSEYGVNASKFYSKAKYSPFDHNIVKGRILKTFVNGKLVFEYN